jgi:Fe-S oxidoreductase
MSEASGPVQDRWRSEEVKEALDLCLACKGCKGDCPVKVDMASYKAEFLSHYYKGRLRPRQAYSLGLIPVWARIASRAPRLANAASHAPLLNRLVKLAGGIAQRRDAPRFATQTFTDWFARHVPRDDQAPVVMVWPDTFTNYFEPQVGIAAVEVLEAAGFHVTLPDGHVCCGRPLYDYGMLDLARRYLLATLETLRPQIEAGVPVIGLEPSCLAVFRDELVSMLPGNLDAQRLKSQSYVLSEFLTSHAPGFVPPRLERQALVQPHCHHHSVIGFDAEKQLLSAMGIGAQLPDAGCCGMAGSFGYEAGERYAVSMAAGERKLLPAIRDADPSTLIIADGFSCRGQIASGTDRRALHLAEVMQLAMREGPLASPKETRTDHHAGKALRIGAGAAVAGAAAAVVYRIVKEANNG